MARNIRKIIEYDMNEALRLTLIREVLQKRKGKKTKPLNENVYSKKIFGQLLGIQQFFRFHFRSHVYILAEHHVYLSIKTFSSCYNKHFAKLSQKQKEYFIYSS